MGIYAELKTECLAMMLSDVALLTERIKTFSPSTIATLRTTRLPTPALAPAPAARVGPSPIHGQGLFAERDIDKGELITLFPVDATFYTDEAGKPRLCFSSLVPEDAVATEDDQQALLVENRDFAHFVSPEGTPLTMSLPSAVPAKEGGAYSGHYANDGLAYTPASDDPLMAAKIYREESHKLSNAAHLAVGQGIFVMTMASKKIRKGEEVLVSYGTSWWEAHHRALGPAGGGTEPVP